MRKAILGMLLLVLAFGTTACAVFSSGGAQDHRCQANRATNH